MTEFRLTELHLRWLQRVVILTFALAILRGLLPPTGFSATVLLFDYDYGLVRRGLMGTIANLWWGDEVTKGEVYAVSAIISLVGLFALFAFVARSWLATISGALMAQVLFSSFAFAALVGLTGYLDLLLIGLVCLAMMTDPNRATGLLARVGAIGFGMFLHELMLGYFTMLLAAELWLRSGSLTRALAPLGAGVVALLVLYLAGNLPPDQIPAFIGYLETKAGFTPDPEAMAVLQRELFDNLTVMGAKRFEIGYRAWLLFDGLPLLAMSGWVLWLLWRAVPDYDTLGRLLALAAVAGPLAINIIAYDIVRFGMISVLSGLLLLAALWSRPDIRARAEAALSLPMILGVVVVNLMFGVSQLNEGESHLWALPWVLLEQFAWF